MPKGTHTGIRVALAVPPRLHEQLSAWAEYEGRPVATLCLFLIETALRQAQRDGYAPSISNPGAVSGEVASRIVMGEVGVAVGSTATPINKSCVSP
jgi:hypothetical protein